MLRFIGDVDIAAISAIGAKFLLERERGFEESLCFVFVLLKNCDAEERCGRWVYIVRNESE